MMYFIPSTPACSAWLLSSKKCGSTDSMKIGTPRLLAANAATSAGAQLR